MQSVTRPSRRSRPSLVLLLAATLPCLAAEPVPVDEPAPEHGKLATADASPVDPGYLEVEAGYSYTRASRAWDNSGDAHSRGRTEEHAPSLALTLGVVDNLDVNLSAGYLRLDDADSDGPTSGNGFGDLGLGGRYRFLNLEAEHLEMAWISGLTVPTGNDADNHDLGTSQEFWSWDNALAVSKDWGRWTANVAAGYSLPFGGKRRDARGTLTADAALGYQLFSWLQPEMELNYGHDLVAAGADSDCLAVTAGLVMPVTGRMRVNLGVQQGVWGRNADQATSLLCSVKVAF